MSHVLSLNYVTERKKTNKTKIIHHLGGKMTRRKSCDTSVLYSFCSANHDVIWLIQVLQLNTNLSLPYSLSSLPSKYQPALSWCPLFWTLPPCSQKAPLSCESLQQKASWEKGGCTLVWKDFVHPWRRYQSSGNAAGRGSHTDWHPCRVEKISDDLPDQRGVRGGGHLCFCCVFQ